MAARPKLISTSGDRFEAITHRPNADVLIIGGGINGLATFRDLALQGVDVALVERNDFVSGASAASSHMAHGGIRYLENGEFRLVQEAVTERNSLLRNAPHFVRPLRTTIPIFSTFSGILSAPLRFLRHGAGKHRERGAVLIKVGLVIYDSFSRGRGRVPRHLFHGRRRSLQQLPKLNPTVKYTATYWDASLVDPERLALDVLRDGRIAGGDRARAANYVAAVGVAEGGVVLQDAETGQTAIFSAPVVINASGPWTDHTNGALGNRTHFMGGTKGSHIVLDHPELLAAVAGRELFFEHRDGRIVLIYPLKGRVLVGTTDLEHDMDEPNVCTEEEVDYFIDLIQQVLPDIVVPRDSIVYRFADVRPLPGHGDLAPGFVSRDYRVERHSLHGSRATVLSLVGGKWTTFRASAEHLADRALDILGKPRLCTTSGTAIGGGVDFPITESDREEWIASNRAGLSTERMSVLLDRYGTIASEVAASISTQEDHELASVGGYTSAELQYLARTEYVLHLDDVLMRRTSLAFVGAVSRASAQEIAGIIAPVLGWDSTRTELEVARGLAKTHAANPLWQDVSGSSNSGSAQIPRSHARAVPSDGQPTR